MSNEIYCETNELFLLRSVHKYHRVLRIYAHSDSANRTEKEMRNNAMEN